jgi:hypothetical protein
MVAGLAFFATAVATVFAQATLVRWSQSRRPHQAAWTVALALFALATAALATAAATGWDSGTFRAFYLLGAITNVPWLALGTVYLFASRRAGDRVRTGVFGFSMLALGVMLSTPLHGTLPVDTIPVGKEHLDALPRVLAAIGSGVGALVVFGGAAWSAGRFFRRRSEGTGRVAVGNALIALGVLVLSSGGLLQGVVGHDESFTISLATGITIIYAGFVVTSGRRPAPGASASPPRPEALDDVLLLDQPDTERRTSLPANVRGSSVTNSTRVGNL